jgi:hypothetical protein
VSFTERREAERFIETALRESAYARFYQNSAVREQLLDLWLHDYKLPYTAS